MNKLRYGSFFFLVSVIFLLIGCGSITSEDAFEESKEAMEEIETVEITFKEATENNEDTGTIKIDFDQDLALYEFDETEIEILLEGKNYITRGPDGSFQSDEDAEEVEGMRRYIDFMKNPYEVLEDFDDELTEKFTAETEDDTVTLTYEGDEEDSHDFATFILLHLSSDEAEDVTEEDIEDFMDYELDEIKVEIVMDESNYLMQEMSIYMELEENDENHTLDNSYTFDEYNEDLEIEKVAEEMKEEEKEMKEEEEALLEGSDVDEDEAAEYLDALIQATVYQDRDGFVKAAPDYMTKEDSENEAEVQQVFFRQAYVDNTQLNMEGSGVTEDEVEDLTDAFLQALEKTEYEIAGAEAIDDEEVIVTVAVKGINDTKIYQDTDDEISELIESGELEEEDFISKNLEILIDMYDDVEVLDETEVEVTVVKEGDNYLVPVQDEYLIDGFVQ